MSENFGCLTDRELRQLEVKTFEIEDLAEVEQIAAAPVAPRPVVQVVLLQRGSQLL